MAALLGQTCLPSAIDAELDDPYAFPEPPMDAEFLAKWHRADYLRNLRAGIPCQSYTSTLPIEGLDGHFYEASITVGTPADVDFLATDEIKGFGVPWENQWDSEEDLVSAFGSIPPIPFTDYYATADGTALVFVWPDPGTRVVLY